MTTLHGLWLGIRPPTLLLGLCPVFIGSAYGFYRSGAAAADGLWQGLMFLLACLLVIAMQSAANLVNDIKDAESGIDKADTRLGPRRVVATGLLSANTVRWAYRLLFGLVLLICLFLLGYGGWQVLALGAICCLFAYLYTGGPWPLSHFGAGEVIALAFFGPIAVAGSAFLQDKSWLAGAFLLGLGPGFIAAAVMAINNFRDRDSDRRAGKKTIATRLSDQAGLALPKYCLVGSRLVLLAVIYYYSENIMVGIAIYIAVLLVSYKFVDPYLKANPSDLNRALKMTTVWSMVYALAIVGVLLL